MKSQHILSVALVAFAVFFAWDKGYVRFGKCPGEAETAAAETPPPAPAPESTAPATPAATPVLRGVAADLAGIHADEETHVDRVGRTVRIVEGLENQNTWYETHYNAARELDSRQRSRLARIRDIAVEGLNEPVLPPPPSFADPAE